MSKLRNQCLFFLLFAFLVGSCLGFLLCLNTFSSTSINSFRIYLTHVLSLEEDEALASFQYAPPSVAIYSQSRFIVFINHLKELAILDEDAALRIQAIAEARIGYLYNDIGDVEKCKEYYENAMQNLKKAKIVMELDQLKSLVEATKSPNR